MKLIRCAIYTRKSSDEGLEQDFNSLDAQREACAAYILSQASEGWQLLPERYDDGGLSGGTLERPALQRLLGDVAAGKIDIIVIYKIDRLTRSLLDFAKLVEAFDKTGTSFVSVTQSFNTTNSMGRLTLNMLLSFAQFEREVTAERIRDKVAASKAKGMWMGGTPPLGYKPHGRSLAIVEDHAALIRDIYARYLKLGNVRTIADQLQAEGLTTPQRKTGTGRKFGGAVFSRGQIYNILKNPVYAGRISHHGKISQGNHKAIIDPDEWEKVQARLAENLNGGRGPKRASASPLAGIIRHSSGEPLVASHARKGDKRYRYYVTRSRQLGEGTAPGMRIPAPEIEQAVARELAGLFADPLRLAEQAHLHVLPERLPELVERSAAIAASFERGDLLHPDVLSEVEIAEHGLVLHLSTKGISETLGIPRGPNAPAHCTAQLELRLTRTGRAIRLVQSSGEPALRRPPDAALVQLVRRAQKWWAILRRGEIGPAELARRENVTDSYLVRVLRTAFLSPRVVEAILTGEQSSSVCAAQLMRHDAISEDWAEQEKRFLRR